MHAYAEWLRRNGAEFDATLDFPAVSPTHPGVFGALAKRDVRAPEPLLSVPRALLVDAPRVRLPECGGDIAALVSTERLFLDNDSLTLTLFLCHEKLRGPASFWAPYLNVLDADTGSLFTWSRADLDELQDGGDVARELEGFRDEREHVFAEIIRLYPPATLELLAWAADHVSSRAFGRRLEHLTLVPLADALNHGNVPTKYAFDGERFTLFPSRGAVVRKGTEALNSYGRRSNRNLLIEYGFALFSNEWDEAVFTLCNLPSPCTLRIGLAPGDLVKFFRILSLTPSALHAVESSPLGTSTVLSHPVSLSLERGALQACVRAISSFANQQMSTTEAQDLIALRQSPGSKLQFAIYYRLGRKRILRFVLFYLRTMLSVVEAMLGEENAHHGSSDGARFRGTYTEASNVTLDLWDAKGRDDGLDEDDASASSKAKAGSLGGNAAAYILNVCRERG